MHGAQSRLVYSVKGKRVAALRRSSGRLAVLEPAVAGIWTELAAVALPSGGGRSEKVTLPSGPTMRNTWAEAGNAHSAAQPTIAAPAASRTDII